METEVELEDFFQDHKSGLQLYDFGGGNSLVPMADVSCYTTSLAFGLAKIEENELLYKQFFIVKNEFWKNKKRGIITLPVNYLERCIEEFNLNCGIKMSETK